MKLTKQIILHVLKSSEILEHSIDYFSLQITCPHFCWTFLVYIVFQNHLLNQRKTKLTH